MDGTKVGTCVGFGVGLRVGSGFGVGAGVGYFVGFAVLGAGVGFREGRGVGFFVNKYGFVRINCSMRSLPRRCCMRQRALRAASSAPHATSTTARARRMAAALFVFYLLSAEAPCTLPKRDAGVEKCRSQLAPLEGSRCWCHRFVLHHAGCRWRPRFERWWSVRFLSVSEVSGAMLSGRMEDS